MSTNQSNAQQTRILGGTKWLTSGQNGPGTFHFNTDNSGTYTPSGDPEVKFYWWQSGNSFWMQEKDRGSGWFSIIEGQLTAKNTGNGQFVVAQQKSDGVYVVPFNMTLKS